MVNTEVENKLPKIFIVDDNVTNLMAGRQLLKTEYNVFPLTSAKSLFNVMEKTLPDLILLDIEMPDMDGYETLILLKADTRYANIPVIFLTAKNEERSEIRGFELGAVDYVAKPFSAPILKKRVENHLLILNQQKTIQRHAEDLSVLVREKTWEIFGLQSAILETVADLVEFRDDFMGKHISHTQAYMNVMLNEVVKDEAYIGHTYNWNLDLILPSCQLHDVGKIAIPDTLLNKTSKLSLAEYELIKTHVTIGMDAIRRMIDLAPNQTFLKHAFNFASAHHEKWDGTGYPSGLSGHAIPLEGRVMAIVDVYDALTSWRPYKRANTHEEAVKVIMEEKGKHFEPHLVEIFLNVEEEFKNITMGSKGMKSPTLSKRPFPV